MNKTGLRWFFVLSAALVTAVIPLRAVHAEETVVNADSGKEYQAGLDLYKKRQYEAALPHFKKAYELDGRNTSALFAEGLAFNSLKRYKEAADVLKLMLEKEPKHEKTLKLYPIIIERLGQTDAALAAYDKSIAALPNDPELYVGKSRIYLGLKKNKEALESLDKALALNPGDIQTMLYKAQTLVTLGKSEEAYQTASAILAQKANHSRALVIVADYKRQKGALDEAMTLYTQAAKDIETKAYAEHYIEVIKQQKEEEEIEREYQERLKKEQKK